MQTVTRQYKASFREKGSEFICFLTPCETADQAADVLDSIRSEHPTATHHCYAFRVNPGEPAELSQDDGEPSGTAGRPILNALRSGDLMNVMAVVVRNYGGTKLGKSGLIEAYGHAVTLAVEQANLKRIIPVIRYSLSYSYNQQTLIDKMYHTFDLVEVSAVYTEQVKLVVDCPQVRSQEFRNYLQSVDHLLNEWKTAGLHTQFAED